MINLNVLVPGAGGPAAINTIKSLRLSKFDGQIVSTDSDPLSAGFFLSDSYYVVPIVSDKSFIDVLIKIIKKNNIKVLMPSSGYDIYQYSINNQLLSEMGVQAVVSRKEVLDVCQDKLLSFKKLSNIFPFAFSTLYFEQIDKFPVIAKPRFGKGSKDIIKIEDLTDLKYVTAKYNNMIFQEYLPGVEYSVDVLSDLNENPLIAIPRIRIQTKAGISVKGKINRNQYIENLCMDLAKHLGIKGPCVIQLKQSESGELKIIEINPRFGGGTFFSTLAGINFPALILDMVCNKEIVLPEVSEITIMRYYEEVVL
jgi:carbamoyl-phosphate synthase large subunit